MSSENATSHIFLFPRDFAAGICNKISEMIQGIKKKKKFILLKDNASVFVAL